MITINEKQNSITISRNGESETHSLASEQGFLALSQLWLRSGWDTKHMYSFTWLGYPIIQLPEDVLRIQELIIQIKPDVIIETGINYGGSLLFYATLCTVMNKGRVVGVEIDVRKGVQQILQEHPLASHITLIRGSSIAVETVDQVKKQIKHNETVLVLLDSKHTKKHVLQELELYSPLVTPGSYIIAMDGFMGHLKNATRTKEEWSWNNAEQAALEFVQHNPGFKIEMPPFLFNDGKITKPVTYCPNGFIRKLDPTAASSDKAPDQTL